MLAKHVHIQTRAPYIPGILFSPGAISSPIGDPTRRGCRKFCLNNTEDVVVCWSSSHLTPSSPARDGKQECVNMVLLNCSFGK